MDTHGHANRKPKPLTLDIYSALLGGRPRIEPPASPQQPRPEPAASSDEPPMKPWLDERLRQHFGRAATQAASLLEDARLRLVDLVSTSTAGRRDVRPRRRVDVHVPVRDRPRDRAA